MGGHRVAENLAGFGFGLRARGPEQWSAADKLAAVIQAAALSGTDLGSCCRQRGLYPIQVARWRQITEDANGPSAPNMADQRELQRKNQSMRSGVGTSPAGLHA